MNSFLRILWPFFAKPTPLSEELLDTAETLERFNAISQLFIESQRQYLESLKFSLNMWMLINSGAAIALIGKDIWQYNTCIYLFMGGAIFSGIGNIALFVLSQSLVKISLEHIIDKNKILSDMFHSLYRTYDQISNYAASFLTYSYICFILAVSALLK